MNRHFKTAKFRARWSANGNDFALFSIMLIFIFSSVLVCSNVIFVGEERFQGLDGANFNLNPPCVSAWRVAAATFASLKRLCSYVDLKR